MRKIYGIILAASVLAAANMSGAWAQSLKKLPDDPKITSGAFPNGMNWYVVSNPAEKGFADFSLVCRHPSDSRSYGEISRRILMEQGRIQGRNLQKFLSSNAVAPAETGYAQSGDEALSFRFGDVMLQRGPSVTDSLLLAVFGIAGELSSTAQGDSLRFPLENMAVIVSGDVNAGEIVTKMGVFSLMIPRNDVSDVSAPVSRETDGGGRRAEVAVDTLGNVCRLSASFRFPRIPREFMPTPRFAVVDKMAGTFRFIAVNRLRDALNASDIPFYGISSGHISSADMSGQECISLSFNVLTENADAAMRCFGEVLGSLDRGEIGVDDIVLSTASYNEKCLALSADAVGNSEYVRICEASFLHGAPLGTEAQLCEFCRSRVLPDTLQLRLMRSFSEALLSPDGSCDAFLAGWNDGKTVRGRNLELRDTLLLPGPSRKKSKVRTGKEQMSGGETWTFQNGLKVHYKRVAGAKKLHWALSLDKGCASVEGLLPGEAAFSPELLKCRSVSGIGSEELGDIMTAAGITADASVSLYSTTLKGTASPRSLNLLLQGLAGLFRDSCTDTVAVTRLMRSLPVRREMVLEGREARIAGIDSLICADNPYSEIRAYGNVTDWTAVKAEKLFSDVFSDVGNGFFVISGDMDPSELKTAFAWYAGEFPVTGHLDRRPRVRFSPVSGQSTIFRSGSAESIDVLMSVALPMTVSNLCTSKLVSNLLEDHLCASLAGSGFHVRVVPSFSLYPQERFSLLVSLDRIPADGVVCGNPEDTEILPVLAALRSALSRAPEAEWPAAVLNAWKTRLNGVHDTETASAEYWRDALVLRYADGRDFSTKLSERMNAVTDAQIKDIMKKIVEGSRVEYVVMK